MDFSGMMKSLSLLMTLLLTSFAAIFQFTSGYFLYITLFLILASIFLMGVMSTSNSFIFLLSVILLTGFGLLFFNNFSLASQAELILQHILLTTSLITIWLLFSEVKQVQSELSDLTKRVTELEKIDGTSNLLTISEFKNRSSLITTGTKRRGEENYYVLFKLTGSEVTKQSLNYVLSKTLLETIRFQFDLVTKLADDTYLVFLQNTKESGCTIVVSRLFNILRTSLNMEELPVAYEIIREDTEEMMSLNYRLLETRLQ